MGLFLVWRHRLICIVVILYKHACKEVCDVKPRIDPYPLLARSCNRWWLDFVTFTAYKKVKIYFKKAQCVSNRCKHLFKRQKYFGVRCTLTTKPGYWWSISVYFFCSNELWISCQINLQANSLIYFVWLRILDSPYILSLRIYFTAWLVQWGSSFETQWQLLHCKSERSILALKIGPFRWVQYSPIFESNLSPLKSGPIQSN